MQFDVSEGSSLFEWKNGEAHFRGLSVERRSVDVGGRSLKVAVLRDAADLLDQPDFARRFIEEDRAPYGMELWPAAIMLADYVLRRDPGEGGRAVELGCGVGLVSMAATLAGWHVTATDNDPIALRFSEYNAALNNIGIAAHEPLDWREPPVGRRFDRVFATDVLYQLDDHAPLLRCVGATLAENGVAMVVDPNRSVANRFEAMAVSHGFRVEVLSASAPGPSSKQVEGRIFRMTRRVGMQDEESDSPSSQAV